MRRYSTVKQKEFNAEMLEVDPAQEHSIGSFGSAEGVREIH